MQIEGYSAIDGNLKFLMNIIVVVVVEWLLEGYKTKTKKRKKKSCRSTTESQRSIGARTKLCGLEMGRAQSHSHRSLGRGGPQTHAKRVVANRTCSYKPLRPQTME